MAGNRVGVPATDVDFSDPDFVVDPFPTLRAIQALGPVVWHERTRVHLITHFRDATRVLANPDRFAEDTDLFVRQFGDETMEAIDDRARHDAVRGVWAKAFQRSTLEQLRAMITEVVDARIGPFVERLRDGGTVDAVDGMIRSIPTIVIARMLGIDERDHRRFSEWSDAMGEVQDRAAPDKGLATRKQRATTALNDYLRGELPSRRRDPGPDLISAMVHAPVAAGMRESEIVAGCTQLVFAGNETTAKLMSQIMLALALHPDQLRAVRENRALVPRAIEEVHRWNTVVHVAFRHVRNGGHTVGDVAFEDGEQVMVLQGAVNRDPERWDDPHRLDLHREPRQHLGFGFGMHSCLGLNLARLELQVWLNRLLDALPSWTVEDVDWGGNWALRGPVRLDVSPGR